MSYYRDKCLQLYERHLREHFATWNDADERAKRAEKILNSEAFSHVSNTFRDKEMRKFMDDLISEISTQVFDGKLEEVVALIVKDMGYVLDNLFTEGELATIFEFASSDVGSRLLRNLDLLGGSYEKGSLILTTEIVERWSRPEIANRIVEFLISLEEGNQPPL